MAGYSKNAHFARLAKLKKEEDEKQQPVYIICEPGYYEHITWPTGLITLVKPEKDEFVTANSLAEARQIREQALVDCLADFCEREEEAKERDAER